MDSISFFNARWPLIVAALLLVPIGGLAAGVGHSMPLGMIAMALVWVAWHWPEWLLLALVVISPIARSGSSGTIPPEVIPYAKMIMALILGFTWAVHRALAHAPVRFPSWLNTLLLAWIALTGLATLHASDRLLALHYLCFSAAGLAAFYVCFHQTSAQKRRLLQAVLACGAVLGFLVLLQYAIVVYHVGTFLERYVIEPRTQAYYASNLTPLLATHYRPSGTMSHPNAMGLYFALLIPFSITLLSVKWLAPLERMLLGGAALVMAAGLYATDSRGAAVYLVVAAGYLAWHTGYRWMAGLGMGGLLLGITFLALSPSRDALLDSLSSKSRMEYGLSGRPAVWANTATLIKEAPLWGQGPGNFTTQYVAHFGFFTPNDVSDLMSQLWAVQVLGEQVIENFHAHNIYLQLAGEIGIFGPLLFFFSVLAVIFHGEDNGRHFPTRSWRRAVSWAIAADAIGLLAYAFFDSQLIFTVGSLNLLAGPLLALGLRPSGHRDVRV